MKNIRAQEDQLFESWAADHKRFVKDGAVDEATFAASMPRLVFVLKEANSPDADPSWDHDLRVFLAGDNVPAATWGNVALWTLVTRARVNAMGACI